MRIRGALMGIFFTLLCQYTLKISRKALFHATSTRFSSHGLKLQVSQLYSREGRQYVCIRYSTDISFRQLPITFKMLLNVPQNLPIKPEGSTAHCLWWPYLIGQTIIFSSSFFLSSFFFMVALCNRADHYIFILFLSSFFFFFFFFLA